MCEDVQIKKSQRDLVLNPKKKVSRKCASERENSSRKKFETQSKKKRNVKLLKQSRKVKLKEIKEEKEKKKKSLVRDLYPVLNGRSAPI